ncbi:unnamed protein product [Lepeophtheirus salmonis]|uniref:(salmon louse) hypothetical protein n=1 Tax=Lepeophtheirus salmonis TaxID=72036 RepID=A0A817FA71_LEPSM|nr:unnamed protein product [Lepeophtheirus salmonis]
MTTDNLHPKRRICTRQELLDRLDELLNQVEETDQARMELKTIRHEKPKSLNTYFMACCNLWEQEMVLALSIFNPTTHYRKADSSSTSELRNQHDKIGRNLNASTVTSWGTSAGANPPFLLEKTHQLARQKVMQFQKTRMERIEVCLPTTIPTCSILHLLDNHWQNNPSTYDAHWAQHLSMVWWILETKATTRWMKRFG